MRAEENTQHTDVVVVGAGVGGLRTTLELAPLRITLVTKTPFGVGGSSPFAQGGIAAAVDREDSPELHAEDTIAAGGGLNNPAIVRLMTRRGARRDPAARSHGNPLRSHAHGQARTRHRRRAPATANCSRRWRRNRSGNGSVPE